MTKKSTMLYSGLISIISVFLFLLLTHPTSFQKTFELKALKETTPGVFQLPETLYSMKTMILIKSPGDSIPLCEFENENFMQSTIQIPSSCLAVINNQPKVHLNLVIQGQAEFYRLLIGK